MVCVKLVGKGGWGVEGGTEKTGAPPSPQVTGSEKSGKPHRLRFQDLSARYT